MGVSLVGMILKRAQKVSLGGGRYCGRSLLVACFIKSKCVVSYVDVCFFYFCVCVRHHFVRRLRARPSSFLLFKVPPGSFFRLCTPPWVPWQRPQSRQAAHRVRSSSNPRPRPKHFCRTNALRMARRGAGHRARGVNKRRQQSRPRLGQNKKVRKLSKACLTQLAKRFRTNHG